MSLPIWQHVEVRRGHLLQVGWLAEQLNVTGGGGSLWNITSVSRCIVVEKGRFHVWCITAANWQTVAAAASFGSCIWGQWLSHPDASTLVNVSLCCPRRNRMEAYQLSMPEVMWPWTVLPPAPTQEMHVGPVARGGGTRTHLPSQPMIESVGPFLPWVADSYWNMSLGCPSGHDSAFREPKEKDSLARSPSHAPPNEMLRVVPWTLPQVSAAISADAQLLTGRHRLSKSPDRILVVHHYKVHQLLIHCQVLTAAADSSLHSRRGHCHQTRHAGLSHFSFVLGPFAAHKC